MPRKRRSVLVGIEKLRFRAFPKRQEILMEKLPTKFTRTLDEIISHVKEQPESTARWIHKHGQVIPLKTAKKLSDALITAILETEKK